MQTFWQKLKIFFLGHPPPRCVDLEDGESCYKHLTVAPGKKLIAGIFSPALVIFWTVAFSDLPKQIEDAQIRSSYGLNVAIAGLVVLWFVSVLATTNAKFTSFGAYLMGGLAAPSIVLAAFTPLVFK